MFPMSQPIHESGFKNSNTKLYQSAEEDSLLNYYRPGVKLINESSTNQKQPVNVVEQNSPKELELMIKFKQSGQEDRLENMKITVYIISINNTQKMKIEITNPIDPLMLYIIELTDLDFLKLKNEQSLLIDFQAFPNLFFKKLEQCKEDSNYSCILHKRNINEALLVIQERTKFKEVNHLILNAIFANDLVLKNYLGNLSTEYKNKFFDLKDKFAQLNNNVDSLSKTNNELKDKINKMQLDKETSLNKLNNSKNEEINKLKEDNFAESKIKIENLEKEKNEQINELNNKINELNQLINNLREDKNKLDDYKSKLELNHKDLESKHAISNTELSVCKDDITHLRDENSSLNKKCFQQEKEITELKIQNDNLMSQIEVKDKSINDMNYVSLNLNKQNETNEDIIKSLKLNNQKLEKKLQDSIDEINKGNGIIQQLQTEIKTQKSKIKAQKKALTTQVQLSDQKQQILDEQIQTINQLKSNAGAQIMEIKTLNDQISNYTVKLKSNEKIIDDNKNMIMFLNKKVNDNHNVPFKSRFNGSGINAMNDNDDMNMNMNMNMNYMSGSINSNNFNSNSKYPSINPTTNYQNMGNNNNNLLYSASNNNFKDPDDSESLFIKPETNFCNYNCNTKIAGTMDKYMNNNNDVNTNTNDLLAHKYGISNSQMRDSNNNSKNSIHNDANLNFGNDEEEEEEPRDAMEPTAKPK